MSVHRVYMRFERLFDEWRVSFTNLSSKDALREFTFADGAKVEAMAARAGALRDLAAKQGLENGLRYGRTLLDFVVAVKHAEFHKAQRVPVRSFSHRFPIGWEAHHLLEPPAAKRRSL